MVAKRSVASALLMLMSLHVVTGAALLAFASPVKDPTVFVFGGGHVGLSWKSGRTQVVTSDTYAVFGGLESVTFTPDLGWHIDAVLIDGNPIVIVDEDGFSLVNVVVKDAITVVFIENGGVDDVETGTLIGTYPDPEVGLIFDAVLSEGFAYAYTTALQQTAQIGVSWDIQTTATFANNITIYLMLALTDLPEGMDPYNLTLWRTEVMLGDVNLDGIVDDVDISIIANANPQDPAYSNLDLNGDGVVNNEDVAIASHNIGLTSVWDQLESWVFVEGDLITVYGVTEHLSVFGVTQRA